MADRVNFKLIMSNYTSAFVFPGKDSMRVVERLQSRKAFAAFSKIKHDVKGKKVPNLSNSDVKYFYHDFSFNYKSRKFSA